MKYLKPHIVKFQDGQYGIRKWFFGWLFKDISTTNFWQRSNHSHYLRGSLERCMAHFDKGEPIE